MVRRTSNEAAVRHCAVAAMFYHFSGRVLKGFTGPSGTLQASGRIRGQIQIWRSGASEGRLNVEGNHL